MTNEAPKSKPQRCGTVQSVVLGLFMLIVGGCGVTDLSERPPFDSWIGHTYTLEQDAWLRDVRWTRFDPVEYTLDEHPSYPTFQTTPDVPAGTELTVERIVDRRFLIDGPSFPLAIVSLQVPEVGQVEAFHPWFSTGTRHDVDDDHPLAQWVGEPVVLSSPMILWMRFDLPYEGGKSPMHELTPADVGELQRRELADVPAGTTLTVRAIQRHDLGQLSALVAVVVLQHPETGERLKADIWIDDVIPWQSAPAGKQSQYRGLNQAD